MNLPVVENNALNNNLPAPFNEAAALALEL